MRSASDDRTARAVIRDEALRLFAAHGPEKVTVRQIAAAAEVSPALVVHHFGSKEGLREAVDQHVVALFDTMLTRMAAQDAPEWSDPAATASLSELLAQHLPPDSPVPAYLRHLLLTDSAAGRQLFRRLHEISQVTLRTLATAGMASPGSDPAVRAAFLLVNDLALLLLRDRIQDVLGVDPLSPDGMRRWAGEALAVYTTGLFANPDTPPTGGRSE
jgi:TetR/AcrR family transcriptional regulator, regulator of cefoperazone and chloramphenicol sensitivity